MASEHKLPIASLQHNIEERAFRLPNGTRKHIRRLKEEGNLKEATLVRNAAIEHQASLHQREGVKLEGDSIDQT